MESKSLKGEVRKSLGKADAKALRNAGLVPCIIYGGEGNIHFSADKRQFKQLIYTPDVYIVSIELDGKTYDTIMKAVQYHPISDEVIHVDFQELTGRPVTLNLPVKLNGTPIGVRNGGLLVNPLKKLSVKGMAKEMDDAVLLDIDELRIGHSIKVKDLTINGAEILNPGERVVVGVTTKRGAIEDEEEEEEDEEGETEGEGSTAEGEEKKEEAES